MTQVSKFLPQGQGLAAVLLKRASEVSLDASQTATSRFQATDSLGRALTVQLPEGTQLHDGDVVILENDLPDLYEGTAGVFWPARARRSS